MNGLQQLVTDLGLSGDETTATANTPQDYLNFLIEILQKVRENPNPQVIYPFLAQNLDKLDENLINVLDNWAKNTLSSVETETATSIAGIIGNFSNLIAQFPLGNIVINKEIAIVGYEIALTVFTFDAFPQEWAAAQNNLANAYSGRIRGDKAENLEKAIACYREALKVYTFDAFPQEWAMTQNNLANAYYTRIREDKAENLEKAIAGYREALKVYTFDAFPQDWAATLMTQKNVKPQGVRQEIIDKLDELRQRWVNEQIRLQSRSINQNISNNDKLTPYISDDSHLKEYRQAWEDFIDEKITPIDPNFKQTQIVQPIPFKDIQALTDAETCLLQWYITSEKILSFVVFADGDIKYWESSEDDRGTFIDAINN